MARSKVRIDFRQNGFAAIRTSRKVMGMLNDIANQVGSTANSSSPGTFIVHPAERTGGRVRGRAAVVTGDFEAMASEARNHILVKALGGKGLIKYTSKAGRVSYITQAQYDNYTRNRKS